MAKDLGFGSDKNPQQALMRYCETKPILTDVALEGVRFWSNSEQNRHRWLYANDLTATLAVLAAMV
jgi:hypothetical protein